MSNGGLSAFRFAVHRPELVASVIGLPGYPPSSVADDAVGALAEIPVAMFVGENDPSWREPIDAFATAFDAAGGTVTVSVRPGQGHVLGDLSGDELLDVLTGFGA